MWAGGLRGLWDLWDLWEAWGTGEGAEKPVRRLEEGPDGSGPALEGNRSKVSSGISKVSSETLKDFYEAIGMKRAGEVSEQRCKVLLPRARCKITP